MPRDCYEIILNHNCDLACRFCSQGDFDPAVRSGIGDALRHIHKAAELGYGRLGFSGGEALLRRDLPHLAAAARRAGFKSVRLQTNGMKLSDLSLCRELAAAGLTVCKFTFLGAGPAVHDRLTGVPGSFKKSLRGLDNMLSLKLAVGVNLLVTKSNYRGLKKAVKFFMDRGVADFVLIYPLYVGNMLKNFKTLGVSMPKASASVAGALDLAAAAGLGRSVKALNMPPCMLPGHEQSAAGSYKFNTMVASPLGSSWDLDKETAGLRERGPVCAACLFRDKCPGVDRRYLELFGWEGFRALTSPPVLKRLRPVPGYLSVAEKCFLEILRAGKTVSTGAVLAAAEDLPLCRNCRDNANILSAAGLLVKKGLIGRSLKGGKYFWRLKHG